MAEGGLMPPARLSKEEVNYRQHEKCATCDHFYPSGVCELVAGTISPLNVCNRWEIKSQNDVGRDRAFYVAEYEKNAGSI
jgi:hypothetical protein